MISDEGKHCVYRHIRFDKDEVFYVGVSTVIGNTFVRAYTNKGRNKIWNDIVKKNGGEFITEILLYSNDYDFILEKEIEFVALYGRINLGTGTLSNLTGGGRGQYRCKYNIQRRLDISKRVKGKKASYETKLKRSISMRKSAERRGYWHSESTKKSMSEAKKGKPTPWMFGRKLSQESRNRVSMGSYVSVLQYSLEGEFIKEWISISTANKYLGITNGKISDVCSGKRNQTGGYKWEYKK